MNRFLIISFWMILFSCQSNSNLEHDNILEDKIRNEVLTNKEQLNILDVVEFEWDSMLIVTPYMSLNYLENKYNIDLSKVEHSGIQFRDDISLLVFFYNGISVNIVEYPKHPGCFSINGAIFINKNCPLFNIFRSNRITVGGDTIIELKHNCNSIIEH